MTVEYLETHCRKIYREAQSFYAEIAPACDNLGFQILYGPPVFRPPILFLGYQPGGGRADYAAELKKGSQDGWPSKCEYATEPWHLAKWLRKMFGVEILERCVGLNAIFVRSPNIETYRKTVQPVFRQQVERFCLPHVERIIELIQPQRVVSIGFETQALFSLPVPDLQNDKGRTLTKIGRIAGQQSIATLHLSGARISTIDRDRIRDRVLR